MIEEKELANLAKLARLSLPAAERLALTREVSAILDYVGQLSQVKIDSLIETPMFNNLRADGAPHPAAEDGGDYIHVKQIFAVDN